MNSTRSAVRGKAPADPWSESCPSRDVLGLLASKWVALLIPLLRRGPRRNGELEYWRQHRELPERELPEPIRRVA